MLKPGERVLNSDTHDYPPGIATPAVVEDGVWAQGAIIVQQYDAFSMNGLVASPSGPNIEQAGTLFLPAWTA